MILKLICVDLVILSGAKTRGFGLKLLKMIMVVAVVVTGLGLGACAQHKEVVTPPMGKTGK